LQLPSSEIVFLSDSYQELDAARAAGWQTCRLVRDEDESPHWHPQVNRFDQINLQELAL